MTTKATLYLDATMYKALKLRAVDTGVSISALMNDALQAQLSEDLSDIESMRSRLKGKGKSLSYEAALEMLRNDGKI